MKFSQNDSYDINQSISVKPSDNALTSKVSMRNYGKSLHTFNIVK
ncbi:hypothetical protein B0I10_109147 [Flavobacterium lacus]|uniref:Uncharacterized protein n=1 Tax=Flavobacterium lacus TaxID=1353778 RepID=A0A328WMB6_9FLAO|nr:hypothetical protein B0I10_109147 [Flavobacterium lacus]